MAKLSAAEIDSLLFEEQASPPTTPATGFVRIYRDTDGNWYEVDDAGTASQINGGGGSTPIGIACSDESTAISAGTGKATLRLPHALTLTAVRASLTSACATGTFTVDINEAGTSVLSTKLTIDATEKTSTTAATAAVISDSALADDAEITVDVDDAGDGTATGLKVWLIGTPT